MSTKKSDRVKAPARSPEARENEMIAYAVDLAEKQLRDGSASSQMITHFLKLGSSREKLEQEQLAQNIQNTAAKTDSIKASKSTDEMYKNAIEAMRVYSGQDSGNDYED